MKLYNLKAYFFEFNTVFAGVNSNRVGVEMIKIKFRLLKFHIQSNSVITNSSGPTKFVR